MNKIFFVLTAAVLLFAACKKTQDLGEAPRIFRPVSAVGLAADSNTIIASWLKMDGVKGYQLEISRDTFQTIDKVFVQDSTSAVIKKLLFNQLYQLRVKSIASDTAKNSGWSSLGAVKTLSSILKQPGVSDITFNSVRVSWTTKGAPVSSIKILKAADSSEVSNVNLTAADLANENKVMTGLASDTKYIILLNSGTDMRGNVNFTTKAPFAGVVIDLTGITGRPSVLTDTLVLCPSGSTILLKRGETYNVASTVNFSKSVTIMSGPDLTTTAQAKIYFTSNFAVANASTIDYIDFIDVYLLGAAYGSNYILNTASSGVNANIGRLKFENCKAEIFRGLVRTQSSTGVNISDYIINGCIIDSIAGYGLITVDNAAGKVDNITITNSTIYKAEKLIASSKVGSVSVLIDNCTVNETPINGNYFIDYGTTLNVTNGIKVNNSIFGTAKNTPASSIRGVRAGSGTTISASNNYRTTDYLSGGNDIPGIITYNRTSTQLWQDPANGNFKIADNTFPGKSITGDPRWR